MTLLSLLINVMHHWWIKRWICLVTFLNLHWLVGHKRTAIEFLFFVGLRASAVSVSLLKQWDESMRKTRVLHAEVIGVYLLHEMWVGLLIIHESLGSSVAPARQTFVCWITHNKSFCVCVTARSRLSVSFNNLCPIRLSLAACVPETYTGLHPRKVWDTTREHYSTERRRIRWN